MKIDYYIYKKNVKLIEFLLNLNVYYFSIDTIFGKKEKLSSVKTFDFKKI